jgi:peptide/nickel transport system substrate-binding protein
MEPEDRRRIEQYRREVAGPVENTLVDDMLGGELTRADLLRRASVFGLSLGTMGLLAACGGTAKTAASAPTKSTTNAVAPKIGGRLRLGVIPAPAGPIEPYKLADNGSLVTANIPGEFLTRATQSLTLIPELALSWKPNHDASVWTFKLRPGVKFQTGQVMTAHDVVATFDRLINPKLGSAALSAFEGVLSPGGIKKVDDLTVQFTLETPTASFPYLTSSTTYQAIILPASYKIGTFVSKPQATGAFILSSYTPGVGAKYDRYPEWWGGRAPLDGVDATYFDEEPPMDAALLGDQTDIAYEISLTGGGRTLIHNSKVQLFTAKGSAHREICMRNDTAPFNDPRVRRALALTLNRPQILQTLFNGLGDIGNDSPFAPAFPSTNASVPQRHQDLAEARELLHAAGHSNLSLKLTTHDATELPELAQIVQASAKSVGVDITINVQSTETYFGGTSTGGADGYGNTPWLNTPFNITDWGDRAVPDVFLTSTLLPKSIWNASRYSNPRATSLIKGFLGAIALSDQRKYAGQLQTLLLKDTPTIYPYFIEWLAAGAKDVQGYKADASGPCYLSKTSLS